VEISTGTLVVEITATLCWSGAAAAAETWVQKTTRDVEVVTVPSLFSYQMTYTLYCL